MIDISKIPIVQFVEANSTRLISTAYINEPALSPLVDDLNELTFLEELEGLSSSRVGKPEFIPSNVQADELLSQRHGYGWTYVNAAFCYTRSTGNRFNGPDRGAWYAAWGETRVETAKREVSWHLTQELHATGIYQNITSYRELNASFATQLHDLEQADLADIGESDPTVGHKAGQALAAQLFANDSNGVLYPSVRNQGGHCVAAFRPHLVQNIRQGDTWLFQWNGESEPEISRVFG